MWTVLEWYYIVMPCETLVLNANNSHGWAALEPALQIFLLQVISASRMNESWLENISNTYSLSHRLNTITRWRRSLIPILDEAPIPIICAILALGPILSNRASTIRIMSPPEVDVSGVAGTCNV